MVLFLSSALSLVSQADPPKAYIDIGASIFFEAQTVTINGKELHPAAFSMGKYDLAANMKDNPIAVLLAEKHESYAKWSGIVLWTGLGAAIGYLYAAPDRPNMNVYWGIFGTSFVTALFLQKFSIAYLFKAINAYNGVESTRSAQLDFSLLPLKNGAALGLNYQF